MTNDFIIYVCELFQFANLRNRRSANFSTDIGLVGSREMWVVSYVLRPCPITASSGNIASFSNRSVLKHFFGNNDSATHKSAIIGYSLTASSTGPVFLLMLSESQNSTRNVAIDNQTGAYFRAMWLLTLLLFTFTKFSVMHTAVHRHFLAISVNQSHSTHLFITSARAVDRLSPTRYSRLSSRLMSFPPRH